MWSSPKPAPRARRSAGNPGQPSGVATQASSSIPRAVRGKWHTTRPGPSTSRGRWASQGNHDLSAVSRRCARRLKSTSRTARHDETGRLARLELVHREHRPLRIAEDRDPDDLDIEGRHYDLAA